VVAATSNTYFRSTSITTTPTAPTELSASRDPQLDHHRHQVHGIPDAHPSPRPTRRPHPRIRRRGMTHRVSAPHTAGQLDDVRVRHDRRQGLDGEVFSKPVAPPHPRGLRPPVVSAVYVKAAAVDPLVLRVRRVHPFAWSERALAHAAAGFSHLAPPRSRPRVKLRPLKSAPRPSARVGLHAEGGRPRLLHPGLPPSSLSHRGQSCKGGVMGLGRSGAGPRVLPYVTGWQRGVRLLTRQSAR
jgi:hypothetical protein